MPGQRLAMLIDVALVGWALPKVEPGNIWAALDLWFDALAEEAELPIPKKWIGRLGGVDVFAKENIKIMAVAHRVDQPKDL